MDKFKVLKPFGLTVNLATGHYYYGEPDGIKKTAKEFGNINYEIKDKNDIIEVAETENPKLHRILLKAAKMGFVELVKD